MPIYEYRCKNCGHELEAIQKVNEDPLRLCPACDTEELVKRVSAAGFRLKGGGWYETDFKSGNKRNVSGDNAGADGASSPSSGGDKSAGSNKEAGSTSGAPDKSSGKSSDKSSDKSSGKPSGQASGGSTKSD